MSHMLVKIPGPYIYSIVSSKYTLISAMFTIGCTVNVQYVPYEPQEHKNRKVRVSENG